MAVCTPSVFIWSEEPFEFESQMMREERMLGYFVGFEFTGDALFEIDRFRRKEGREIRPLTVREILDEEIASDSPGNS
jgi:hypothetical protein